MFLDLLSSTVSGEPGLLQMYDTGRFAGFNWTRNDGLYTMFFDSETSFVLNGMPYVHELNANGTFYSKLQYDASFNFNFWTGTRICEDLIRWENLSIDPFLGLIFNGQDDLTKPPSPSTRKNRLSTGAAIGIAIGAIAIVGAVIALAIVSYKVPAVKHFFRPFSERSEREASTRVTNKPKETNGNWSSTKPVSDLKNTN